MLMQWLRYSVELKIKTKMDKGSGKYDCIKLRGRLMDAYIIRVGAHNDAGTCVFLRGTG